MNETNHQNCMHSPRSVSEMAYIPQPRPAPGLDSLYMLCNRIYPDQRNPLQATTLLKYWLGGEDPLDYISMYNNPGDRMIGIPAHWHYIGFGLSNLHGDTRVHRFSKGPNAPSGFGFELTFRLLKDPEEHNPPTWPAHLMQSLAKYVFATGNTLYAGDHVSWHHSLDGSSSSSIEHMLMAEDPQLQVTGTPYGTVRFIQIVGVLYKELQAVQRWNGPGVLQILKRHSFTGGPWLITNMRRYSSMFDLDQAIHFKIAEGIETEGSNLCGISVNCSWKESNKISNKPGYSSVELSMGNLCLMNNSGATNEDKKEIDSNSKCTNCELSHLAKTRYIEEVHLTFNVEAGLLLPLVLKGRIRHGRHFTFNALDGKSKITFVCPSVSGISVSDEKPFAAQKTWLQVLVPNNFIDTMESSLEFLEIPVLESFPKTINWPDRNLTITIKPDGL